MWHWAEHAAMPVSKHRRSPPATKQWRGQGCFVLGRSPPPPLERTCLPAPSCRSPSLLAAFQSPEDFTVRDQKLEYSNGDRYEVRSRWVCLPSWGRAYPVPAAAVGALGAALGRPGMRLACSLTFVANQTLDGNLARRARRWARCATAAASTPVPTAMSTTGSGGAPPPVAGWGCVWPAGCGFVRAGRGGWEAGEHASLQSVRRLPWRLWPPLLLSEQGGS